MLRDVLSGVLSGPAGIAGLFTAAAARKASTELERRENEFGKQQMSLNRWKCRDTGSAVTPQPTADQRPPFHDVKYLGEQNVDGVAARAYQLTVDDASSGKSYPVTYYAAAKTGLPMKMQMKIDAGQGMGGSVSLEYFDFDVPIQIDVPDCMK